MVDLVTRMLDLHKKLIAEPVPHAKTVLQRQIDATDRQIDALVYELYGLTGAEFCDRRGACAAPPFNGQLTPPMLSATICARRISSARTCYRWRPPQVGRCSRDGVVRTGESYLCRL
jgi:hypothetical protein